MTRPRTARRWTIVQHSGYGYNDNPAFEHGLETRQAATYAEQNRVEKAGGILFDSYSKAEDFAEAAMNPPGCESLIPAARGTFSNLQIDGLAIYIPVREVVG